MGWRETFKILKRSYANAAEMVRLGRLTDPHRTPFEVVHSDRIFGLRRYYGMEGGGIEAGEAAEGRETILLIPPLMVTSEIYDMSPDVSAASYLLGQGLDVWMVDFGAPERVEGGMSRTLDDHVRAVSDAIEHVAQATGRDVHVAGYSQGGMFCYQAAAYRQSERVASVITFGSPVDIYRNLPVPVSEQVAEKMIGGLRQVIERPLNELDGLPGFLTSFGFKMVSPKKEAQQLVEFVRKLHDRQALEKRESRRRFLGGEGFVAWPGPALRTFVDEFIVANRMASGGFVIDGRTVSLADVTCPILYFVGLRDDIARPASVRAIKSAAFNADCHELGVRAGHLGLVVGSRALGEVWPTVVSWMRWIDEGADFPERLRPVEEPRIEDVDDVAFDELDLDVEDFTGFATDAMEDVFRRLARAGSSPARSTRSAGSCGSPASASSARTPRSARASRSPAGGGAAGRDLLPLEGARVQLRGRGPAHRRDRARARPRSASRPGSASRCSCSFAADLPLDRRPRSTGSTRSPSDRPKTWPRRDQRALR
ncbi:MAG: alpha/beta fold hydrolase [Sandaracinaceae bacterium]